MERVFNVDLMDKPIRILQIGMHNKIGGVETYLMNYYRNIDRSKIQFDFINPYDKLCFEDEIKKLGGQIYKVPNFKKNPIGYYFKIKKIIKQQNYNIVHINMLSAANILPILAASKCKVNHVIAHSHNGNVPEGFLRSVLNRINKKIMLKKNIEFFACSNLAGKWLFGENQKFEIINNAIDLDRFKYNENSRKKIRDQYNLQDKYVIGHIGRFSYQKNHEFLIDAFSNYAKKDDNVILMLIGEGELEENIRAKVKNLDIEDKVLYIGTTNNIPEYLSAMDIFVLPSRFEGFPVTGVEAQANGLTSAFSNLITREIDISGNCSFLELNINKWVNFFENNKNRTHRKFNDENYDSKNNAKLLEQIYMGFNKIKIAHVVYGLSLGGVETVLYNYFKNSREFENIIIVQNEINQQVKRKFEDIGFTIYKINKKSNGIFQYISSLKKILKEENINIIHSHMTLGNFLPNFVGTICGIKIRISHSHFAYIKTNFIKKLYKKLGKIFSTHYMACSEDAAKFLFEKDYKKAYILNNAIDKNKFVFDNELRHEMRNKYSLDNLFVIGNIGRFVSQKNQLFLLQVCYKLKLTHSDCNFKLFLVGSGELENTISQKITELSLEKDVIIVEPCDDVEKYYSAFDVFCFPSLFEGLGMVLVEAQINGLKCISSNRVPTSVKINDNYVSLELEDIDMWVEELYITWYNKKKRVSLNTKKFIDNGFDIYHEQEKLIEFYGNLER